MKYKVEYSKTNDTYRVMGGDKIVTDFATKERADAEAKRLNSLQSVKDVDKAQEKKSLKEKIQELSLDQKAKLYFMGLVRQGKIDTLPEDPKAAYIRDMMDKEDPKMDPAIRSDFDEPVFENDKDDYGRSVSGKDKRTFMEPEDSMPAARARKKVDTSAAGLEPADSLDPNASDDRDNFPNPEDLEEIGMFHDPLGYDPEDSADSKEDKLKMAYAAYDKAEMNGDIRGQELALAVIDLLKSGELKEMATELGYLKEIDLNAVSYEKVTFIYTEQGGRFYGLDVYENKDQPQRSAKLRYDEANEWLKDTLHYIHEGDLIPKSYNSGLEDLDLIVARLKELGIEASHGDYMDVS